MIYMKEKNRVWEIDDWVRMVEYGEMMRRLYRDDILR